MRSLALAIAATALTFGATSAMAQTELRFGHAQPPASTLGKATERFAELVAEKTGGEVTVTLFPGGALGGNSQMVQSVRSGALDITANGNGFYTAFAPQNNVIDLPYIFNDYDHVIAVLDGEIGRGLLDNLDSFGIKGLAFLDQGFRNLTNSSRPVRVPADVKDLKVRVTPNPAHVLAFETLGANPVSMSFTEVYMALQTKTVDAQENPIQIIYSNRFQEVQKYLSLTRHAYTAGVMAMNRAKFESLSEANQAAIVEAASTMASELRETHRALETEQLEALREAGMEVIEDVDREAFKAVVAQPTRDAYKEANGDELLEAVLDAGN